MRWRSFYALRLITLIFSIFVGSTAHPNHSSAMNAEFDTIQSSLKLLRNKALNLRNQNNAFLSRSKEAVVSLRRKETEDNAIVNSISAGMKREMSRVVERVETKLHHKE